MEKFIDEEYDFSRSILFCGPTGVGKTYRARNIVKRFFSDKFTNNLMSYEISDPKFKQLVKSNALVLRKPEDRNVPITMYPLEIMLRCGILLYDDLGLSDTSDAYLRDFTFIIDERINKSLLTIYTSNLTKEELSHKMNERIVSRILYNTDVVVVKGEDKRLLTTKYMIG